MKVPYFHSLLRVPGEPERLGAGLPHRRKLAVSGLVLPLPCVKGRRLRGPGAVVPALLRHVGEDVAAPGRERRQHRRRIPRQLEARQAAHLGRHQHVAHLVQPPRQIVAVPRPDQAPVALERRRLHAPPLARHDARVTRDRQEVGAFLDAAREVEEARGDVEAEASMQSMPAGRLPDWQGWREKAVSVVDKAETLVEEIPERELVAHLAAFGSGPNGIEEKDNKIREQIARDAQARAAAEEERRAAEQARDAEVRRRDVDRLQAMLDAVQERGALTGRLQDCLAERETLEADVGRFIHREEYTGWRSGAESLLAEANRHLDQMETLAPREKPGVDTLRTVSEKLERTLREDRAELERIRRERSEEKTRQQDRSQDRGFSR